jgi:predicted RNA-binding Zn-ribbon protein involved in translation (DUF1610 family)
MVDSLIKSRPVYPGLQVDPHARQHLFVLEGAGMEALIGQLPALTPQVLARADVLYVAHGMQPAPVAARLRELGLRDFWQTPTIPTLLPRLAATLAIARMGLRLYVAGTEGFIGQVLQVAMSAGIDPASVGTEHRGSLVRRVQCVHCKGISEAVRESPFRCTHCGLMLLVRDHFSRRLAAFQGVNVDAEAPGTAPAPEELYR